MQLTKAQLDAVLRYDAETGIFYSLARRGSRLAGSQAGTQTRGGYIRINVLGVLHYAHRLAWLTTHGSFPEGVIDHINGDKCDNRIANLRDVTHAENLQNQFRPIGKNPYLGVTLVRGKWQAIVMRFGLSVHLGMFDTAEEASIAYQRSKDMTHEQFIALARSMRRRNKLASELMQLLREFPGFDSTPEQQTAWEVRRKASIN